MTFNDRQQYKILTALNYTEGKEIPRTEFIKLFKDIFGNSDDAVFTNMSEQNLIKSEKREIYNDAGKYLRYDHTCFVTSSGIEKYRLLKKQKGNQIVRNLVAGLTLLFTAVGLAYSALTYHDQPNNDKSHPADSTLQQTKETQKELLQGNTQYDNKGVHKTDSDDSLTKVKNETIAKDTAALKRNPIDKTTKPK